MLTIAGEAQEWKHCWLSCLFFSISKMYNLVVDSGLFSIVGQAGIKECSCFYWQNGREINDARMPGGGGRGRLQP